MASLATGFLGSFFGIESDLAGKQRDLAGEMKFWQVRA
jgi:hypothetical protein